jgi:type II secretory ATPase GspE/PulE/Tfp pilus assembly ATPase PilB-like protein
MNDLHPILEMPPAVDFQIGMLEFRPAAMLKVARGQTSAEEVLRVIPTEYLGLED